MCDDNNTAGISTNILLFNNENIETVNFEDVVLDLDNGIVNEDKRTTISITL